MIPLLLVCFGSAAAQTIELEGVVPDGLDHFFVPFEVPPGIVEIEVRHGSVQPDNVLDWGLQAPDGSFRGWGGGNSEPAIVGELAASRSYLPGPITAGTWQVVVGKAKIGTPPGDWWAEVDLRTEATVDPDPDRQPWAPPAEIGSGARWVRGDLHVHSTDSGDAAADLDAIATLAAERGLDFVVITDHNTIAHVDRLVSAQARNPNVLLIPGIEWTSYDGHANLIGATQWVDHKVGQPGVDAATALAEAAASGAVVSINHPTLDLGDLCIGCAWDHPFPEAAGAVEIATGGWDPVGYLFTPAAIEAWQGWLQVDPTRQLAAIGGSDDHKAGVDLSFSQSPIGDPTTVVWVEALTVEGVLDGLRAGKTSVQLQGPDDPQLTLELVDGVPMSTVTGGGGESMVWVVDGVPRTGVAVDGDPATDSPTDPVDPGRRVRVELWVDGDVRVVTSEVTVPDEVAQGGPSDAPADGGDGAGCGCQAVPWQTGSGLQLLARRPRAPTTAMPADETSGRGD